MSTEGKREFTLAELLGDKNLTRIAERIGVSPALTCLWRSGRRKPSVQTRAKLAEYFGLDPSQIVLEQDEAA